MGATALALVVGFGAFRSGNKGLSQQMMRARIAAQFATVGALVGGSVAVGLGEDESAPSANRHVFDPKVYEDDDYTA